MPRLPRLLRLTHSLEEREQRRDAERRRHHGEGTCGGVAHVLVEVVDIGTHRGNHDRQACCLGEVCDDLASLHAGVVVLVDQQRLDDDEDLVDVGPHQLVQLVQDAVDDLDEKMALLVLEGGGHEQRQDLVEEGAGPELPALVRELAQRLLAHGGGAVLDLEEQFHDLTLVALVLGHLVLVLVLQQRREELVILRLHKRQSALGRRLRHLIRLLRLVPRHLVPRVAARRGRGKELTGGGDEGLVGSGGLQHFVAVGGEEGLELFVVPRPVALVHLLLEPHVVHLLGGHAGKPAHHRGSHVGGTHGGLGKPPCHRRSRSSRT
mmetsp:Transcript_20363/g.39500  ORF Transcript_20363/g.39500 Transcript_20363/m.39500 type:complete len:321 (+) Transcript_20363:1884-2846(+)